MKKKHEMHLLKLYSSFKLDIKSCEFFRDLLLIKLNSSIWTARTNFEEHIYQNLWVYEYHETVETKSKNYLNLSVDSH